MLNFIPVLAKTLVKQRLLPGFLMLFGLATVVNPFVAVTFAFNDAASAGLAVKVSSLKTPLIFEPVDTTPEARAFGFRSEGSNLSVQTIKKCSIFKFYLEKQKKKKKWRQP